MYTNPKNIFQEKIKNVLKREKENIGILEHIFKLQQILSLERYDHTQYDKQERTSWETLLDIYNLLGPNKFSELLSLVHGKTLTFPTEAEYQDSLITGLCYYYREIESLPWKDIRDRLDMPNLHNLKYGMQVTNLKNFINSGIMKSLNKKEPK